MHYKVHYMVRGVAAWRIDERMRFFLSVDKWIFGRMHSSNFSIF